MFSDMADDPQQDVVMPVAMYVGGQMIPVTQLTPEQLQFVGASEAEYGNDMTNTAKVLTPQQMTEIRKGESNAFWEKNMPLVYVLIGVSVLIAIYFAKAGKNNGQSKTTEDYATTPFA